MVDITKLLDEFMKLLGGLLAFAFVILIAIAVVIWVEDVKKDERKTYLCHQAAACKKYSKVREECATAGSFKTCLEVKMGADGYWFCTGNVEGGPALPLPPETPNSVDCFFRTLF
jgi:predicted outer membrane lipoprotein